MASTVGALILETPFLNGENFVNEDHTPPDFRVAAANAVAHICRTTTTGHILVYAPGSGEIKTIRAMLKSTRKELQVSILFSAMSLERQREALCATGADKNKRRCLIATDLAIKAPAKYSIHYIVDTGLRKVCIYNPRLNMHMLETRLISLTRAELRYHHQWGGSVCVRLYSKSTYNGMPNEVSKDHLNEACHLQALHLLAHGVTDLAGHERDEAPHPDTLAMAVQDLVAMDLSNEDGNITELGKFAYWITDCLYWLEPAWALAIYEASQLDCLREVIAIAAICSAKLDIFQDHNGMEVIAGIVQAKFASAPSDHLALLNAYAQYRQLVFKREPWEVQELWCKVHTLNLKALTEVDDLVNKISTQMARLRSQLKFSRGGLMTQRNDQRGRDVNILKAITRGFCTQIAIYQGTGDKYCTFDTNVVALLHARSVLNGVRPQWVVYTKLSRRSRRQYLDIVSPVNVKWLLDLKNFQPGALALGCDNQIRQPNINKALDAARASIAPPQAQTDN